MTLLLTAVNTVLLLTVIAGVLTLGASWKGIRDKIKNTIK